MNLMVMLANISNIRLSTLGQIDMDQMKDLVLESVERDEVMHGFESVKGLMG